MKVNIDLHGQRFGFSAKTVNKIFGEFHKVERHKTLVKEIDVILGDNEACNLGYMLMWMLSKKCMALPTTNTFRIAGKIKSFDDRHFFDTLTGSKNSSSGSEHVKVDFETFRDPNNAVANRKENELFEKIAGKFLDTKNNLFHKEVRNQILEVFANAFDHSKSNSEASCLCSLSDSGLLDFCVCDEGIGFKDSFMSNPAIQNTFAQLNHAEVIERSMALRVTCNPPTAKNPNYSYGNAGIGLYFLNQFVTQHPNSQLIIMSKNGLASCQSGAIIKCYNLPYTWNGSIVAFRTNINQAVSDSYNRIGADFIDLFDKEPA